MIVQASKEVGEDSDHPTDSNQIPIVDQPSTSSKPKKKQKSRRKQRKEAEVSHDETEHEESVPTPSNDPLPSGEDIMQLTDLMVLCTKLQKQVLDLENARLSKVGAARRVESFEDKDSLGDQEDPSKQGRNKADIDQDLNVTLIDETQGKLNDEDMFRVYDLHGEEVIVEDTTAPTIPITTAEVVTTVSAPTTTIDELTLAQTLIEIKAAKPKTITSVTIATTSVTTAAVTRPKAKGIVFHDQEEQVSVSKPTVSSTQPSIKDKGKAIIIESESPLKNKDQVAADEELARQLYGEMQAKIAEEERIKRQKEEEANIALIESWDNTQAMMKADFELAQKIQADKQGEITIEERSKLFNLEVESSMKARIEIRTRKHNDQEEAELKKHLEIVRDDDIAIDAIPLATKPPVIIEYKIVKEGIIRHFQLIRADRSSKRYSSMIKMLQGINREDLQTLWKLVKAKHGDTRPEDEYERVQRIRNKAKTVYEVVSTRNDPEAHVAASHWWIQPAVMSQPEGFIDQEFPDHVYRLKKALYGLKQAPRAWALCTLSSQSTRPLLLLLLYVLVSSTPTGCKDDCKSTSGGLQFLGGKLVSWSSKKQDCTTMSTAEAEYVSLSACCAQVIWMRTQLLDYGYKYNRIPMYCDSKSAIAISCNPVQHSKTKHIDIRYHFIKEHVEKGTVEIYFVGTEYQLADLFRKALPKERFEYLVHRIGMRCMTPTQLESLTKLSS
ncbi:retrovirus-related pol polyprotein from transposon TNT 1-94 [Tanacetum coccineum]